MSDVMDPITILIYMYRDHVIKVCTSHDVFISFLPENEHIYFMIRIQKILKGFKNMALHMIVHFIGYWGQNEDKIQTQKTQHDLLDQKCLISVWGWGHSIHY